MPDADFERLASCFTGVFPKLAPANMASATAATVEGWDSVAQVTLLTLIGEEFGLQIDFIEFEDATSFQAILELVKEKTRAAG